MNILIVEDDTSLSDFIQKGLQAEGMQVSVAYDGFIGKLMVKERSYDVLVLDVNLPGLNGIELCRFSKEQSPQTAVLLLTALGQLEHKEIGFQAGADDYLTKPFDFKELVIRLKALVRRKLMNGENARELQIADLVIDMYTRSVVRAGKPIALTPREYSLLEYLMRHQNQIVSRADILQHVWGNNFEATPNVVDVYVNYLRRKIDREFEPKLLQTIIGMGYQLRIV